MIGIVNFVMFVMLTKEARVSLKFKLLNLREGRHHKAAKVKPGVPPSVFGRERGQGGDEYTDLDISVSQEVLLTFSQKSTDLNGSTVFQRGGRTYGFDPMLFPSENYIEPLT